MADTAVAMRIFKFFFSVNNDCRVHDLCECDCVRTSCQNLDVKESEGKKTNKTKRNTFCNYILKQPCRTVVDRLFSPSGRTNSLRNRTRLRLSLSGTHSERRPKEERPPGDESSILNLTFLSMQVHTRRP